MSNIGKFQLPPIKGTDVFPSTMQAPPIVRTSVEFIADPDRAYRPEVLEDYAKEALTRHSEDIGNFVLSQRQNYQSGVVDFMKHRHSTPEYDVSYSNNQGLHEIVMVNFRVDIRRAGKEEVSEDDPLMLLVLYEGNRIAAIPMGALSNLGGTTAILRQLSESSWGAGYQAQVVQHRLSDEYSVVESEISLLNDQITETMGSVFIVHDDSEQTLIAGATEYYTTGFVNGSGNSVYTGGGSFTYSPDGGLTAGATTSERIDAIDQFGQVYINERREDGSATDYANNVMAWETGHNAVDVDVYTAETEVDKRPFTVVSNYEVLEQSCTEITSYPPCQDRTCTLTTRPSSGSQSGTYTASVRFDGISLGGETFTVESSTGTTTKYLVTEIRTYSPVTFSIFGYDPPDSQNQKFASETSSGGAIKFQYISDTAVNVSYSIPPSELACHPLGITCLDKCANPKGPLCGTWPDTLACGVAAREHASLYFCGWCPSSFSATSLPVTSTSTTKKAKIEGEINSARLINFPYAVQGQTYYVIKTKDSLDYTTPYETFSAATDSQEQFIGLWNLLNGEHIIQAYCWGAPDSQELRIFLDGNRVESTLAGLLGTSVSNITAVFMDIHLSKFLAFK